MSESNTFAVGSSAHLRATKANFENARRAACKADEDLKERYRKAREAFERDFVRETVGLRTALSSLRRIEHEAEAEWNTAKVAFTKNDKTGLPEGATVFEWSNAGGFYYSGTKRPMTKTGRVGRVEVWTPESLHPVNVRWGLPAVGDKYVRLLKKDGTPSAKFETLNGWRAEWLPEGKEPKA